MSQETPAAPPMRFIHSVQLFLLIVASVAAFIYLGTTIGLTTGFAGFTLLWYWATVEQAEFNRLVPSVVGALVGVGLAWLFAVLPVKFGMEGLVAAYAVTASALFVVILNWLPQAVNGATMLFVTILGAPALLTTVNFPQLVEAVVLAAVFFAAVVYGAKVYVAARDKKAA